MKLFRRNSSSTQGMDISFAINRNWILCTFASFTGCIVVALCLHHRQNNLNVSTLENIAISVTSSDAASSLQLFGPADLIRNDTVVKEAGEEMKCNIFDGKWVYDPEGSPLYTGAQCPFLSEQVSCQRNGRLDSDYERWSWEGKGCDIPRFNGTNMLERLRGKRVVIVGDSLNRNQWESLACLLYSAIPSSRAHVNDSSSVYKVFKAKDYNCSVEFYWSPFLVQLDVKQANGSRILRLDRLSETAHSWKGADVIVFNTGHWWTHAGKLKAYKFCRWDLFQYEGKLVEEMNVTSAFDKAIRTWARWISDNVDPTKTTVFFRSISPDHKGKQWCYNRTQPIMDETFVNAFPKPITEIVERTIEKMKGTVRYLNIMKLSQYRRDAHPALFARKKHKLLMTQQHLKPESHMDCSHWCLPGLPDTWNRLLYASLVSDSLEAISGS